MTTADAMLTALATVSARKEAGKVSSQTSNRKSCPRCRQRSNDGLLCHDCTRITKKALRATVEWWPDLWTTITKQARMAEATEGHAINSERPLTFDYLAADLANEIRASLVGWVKVTMEDCGAECPRDLISSMCDHLEKWLPALRKHEAAVEFADEVCEWPRKIKAAVDYKDERSHIPVGPCPEPVENATCGGLVSAVLFADDYLPPVMRCGKCKAEWSSWQWHNVGRRMLAQKSSGKVEA